MQSTILLCFAALVSYSYADYRLPGLDQNDFFKDLYFQRNLARGQVFGGLGANDAGLFVSILTFFFQKTNVKTSFRISNKNIQKLVNNIRKLEVIMNYEYLNTEK